ncbi:hypothetical protein CRM22_011405 [Opisthorchis felineus]|uniref:Uncharacterized protein n=1 Tax=Opisthorchis felineus TaxID=147828 RepID=A0A4S2JIC9_OPIFE|nr:hypothetical protein CRM22_011405 [Opisthorchis felineus]
MSPCYLPGYLLSSLRKFSHAVPCRPLKVYFETYGCQMNRSDTEVAKSVLSTAGLQNVSSFQECDTVLLMTCAIRESSESKIWRRLHHYRLVAKQQGRSIKIGVLGCMAERLKEKLLCNSGFSIDRLTSGAISNLEPHPSQSVGADFVCGPDAYRDLPRLIANAHAGIQGASVALSLEETYADVRPVRRCQASEDALEGNQSSPSAFISVMRGCDNMCTYCIVPFVRGRERSRPLSSIIDEAAQLFEAGVRNITLLGQNVNSYCDHSVPQSRTLTSATHLTPGFHAIYRPKLGGLRFVNLLDEVSRISPELRIRFTSPHPKDFPPEVLQLIAERHNICSHLHLPAQSGSATVLDRMGRGYTPDAYLALVETVRKTIPGVAITSDFIAGFCGETEDDHEASVQLIKNVGYSFTFCFPYSMREKTRAYHRLVDDVPLETKNRRHLELRAVGRQASLEFNRAQIGQIQLVLVEGRSRRSFEDVFGFNDCNVKVIFPRMMAQSPTTGATSNATTLNPGDYVAVRFQSPWKTSLRLSIDFQVPLGRNQKWISTGDRNP